MMSYDITQISHMLASKAEGVCGWLLPNGKKHGAEWECGSVAGEEGRSLRVHLTGSKAGVWSDFAGEHGGDLVDLIAAVKNMSIAEAVHEAKDYLGIDEDKRPDFLPKRTAYKRPQKVQKLTKPGKEMLAWFANRGLTAETVAAFKIGEIPGRDGQPVAVFPYLVDGEVVFIKYRPIHDKKGMWTAKDAEPVLFGWQIVEGRTRDLVITEGELDAMSLYQAGYAALSVPRGGGDGEKQDAWIASEFERLQNFDRIFLALDMDEQGQKAAAHIATRLGAHRCFSCDLGKYKDANEALMDGADMGALFDNAHTLDPQELRTATSYIDDVFAFYADGERRQGERLPWSKTYQTLGLRAGETTIWAGINGHGKALALSTRIPTVSGWKTIEDVHVGDIVFDENGNQCNVIAETDVMTDRPCYRMTFSDGTTVICDEQHEWVTETCVSRASQRNAVKNDRVRKRDVKRFGVDQTYKREFASVKTTKQIYDTLLGTGCRSNLKNHSVHVCGVVKYNKKDLPIPPYTLGAWLGDGTSSDGSITVPDKFILRRIESEGFVVTDHKGKISHGILKLQNMLDKCCLLNNKHVPDEYLTASSEQRIALLQGLMDTDGCVVAKRCEFCSTNKNLAYSVLELVRSLGIIGTIITGKATLYGKECGTKYRVCFTTDKNVFSLPRKALCIQPKLSTRSLQRFVVNVEKVNSEPVKCIQVDSPSHLYLCTDAYIPTHNSQILGHVMVASIAAGARWCIASMEFKPHKLLARMFRQACATNQPDESYRDALTRFCDDRLWVFDVQGTAKAERILEVFDYAYRRYGVDHFCIDSLAKCGFGEDAYNDQKAFVDKLSDFARNNDCHVHLVCHSRKRQEEDKMPDKFDIKGTGAITDMVDNVFIIWRNKAKEQKLQEADSDTGKKFLNKTEPDALLNCVKQREGEWEGLVRLWFDQRSLQFMESVDALPVPYVTQGDTASTASSIPEHQPVYGDAEAW